MQMIRPLLAAKTTDADLKSLRYPILASPKIDGVRALVVCGKLKSRTMKDIPNLHTQALLGRDELDGLDGELCVGKPYAPNLMQSTMSGVMSIRGIPHVTYHVFDLWDDPDVFQNRLSRACNRNMQYGLREDIASMIIPVQHATIQDFDQLLQYEQWALSLGYEGVMLRDPLGRYKQNRSTLKERILLKVKRFTTSEAVILGTEPLYRNLNEATSDERGYTKRSSESSGKVADELLGSLDVRCLETGARFNIGSGFTESQRRDFWRRRQDLKGQVVTYRHFEVTGVKDKPRFPIFVSFRDRRDM